jgi:hypothetical protein
MTAKRSNKKPHASPKKVSAPRRQSSALASTRDFAALVERVVTIIEEARSRVVRTVNSEMVLSYWHIGREVVEYVQRGEARAEYGEQVIEDLSAQLLARVGRGYSARNLWYFRDFYLTYKERPATIRAEVFRTSLVQNSKRQGAAKILHEAGSSASRVRPLCVRVTSSPRSLASCRSFCSSWVKASRSSPARSASRSRTRTSSSTSSSTTSF